VTLSLRVKKAGDESHLLLLCLFSLFGDYGRINIQPIGTTAHTSFLYLFVPRHIESHYKASTTTFPRSAPVV
jgi:hypothetical protein